MPWAAPPAIAQPAGGQVVSGQAAITSPTSYSTLITQASAKAIIEWQRFSVGSGQSVQFVQPNASSITLNRVTGTALSTIAGSITSNGQIWLVNPNGVMFGQGATVNVGGLLATTSDIANADFLSGNYAFAGAPAGSSVTNKGLLSAAAGGSIVLSAPRVTNSGLIVANAGHVVLGGADAFTVDFKGDHLLSYAVTAPAHGADAGVSNDGVIKAPGGKVLLTARAAAQVQNGVVNNSGIIEATSARVENGEIVLDAGDGAAVNSGTLDASGKDAGQSGGTVKLLGQSVAVSDGAKIDVSGDAGGGTALIGGNLHGAGPEPNAQTVTVGKATIKADAITHGNGGTVAIYSTGQTKVAASISAKGGTKDGNGGQVETSGHTLQIDDATTVTTAAVTGTAGDWLLDPGTINIDSSGSVVLNSDGYTFNDDPSTSDTVTISPVAIANALSGGNVRLEASVKINVNNDLTYNSPNSLTLLSEGSINLLNAAIQNGGSGSIVLVAGWDGSSHPTGLAAANTYGLTSSGTIELQGQNEAIGSASGPIYLSGYGVTLVDNGSPHYAQIGYHGAGGGDINIEMAGGGVNFTEVYGGVTQIGNGGYDGTIQSAATGNITIVTTGATVVKTNSGTAKIGNYSGGNGTSGNVSLVTNTLSNGGASVAYDASTLINDNIQGGNVVLGTAADLAISSGISWTSTSALTLLSKGSITVSASIQNSQVLTPGSIVLVAGWDGSSIPTALASAGTYGLNSGGTITIQGTAAVGSYAGATYLSAYGLSLQGGSGTNNYAQVGYHAPGGGDISVQTLAGGVALNQFYADSTSQIGNGGFDGTIGGAAGGNIAVTTTGNTNISVTSGNVAIRNYAGSNNNRYGTVTLTTGTMGPPSYGSYGVNDFITDAVGTSNFIGSDVSLALTAATGPTTINALSYSSPHNISLSTNNGFTFAGNITNAGTGSLSLASASALTDSSAISLGGNLIASSNGGAVTLSGALTIGGTTTLSSSAGPVSAANTGNALSGAVSVAAYGGSFGGPNQIEIVNSGALTLGDVTVADSGNGTDYGAIEVTTNAGNINITANLWGGGITLNAAGSILETGSGNIWSHHTGGNTIGGGLALNATTSISLPAANNRIEQADDGMTLIAPGQLVLSAGGAVNITLNNNQIALYGAYAGGDLSIAVTGSYSLNNSAVYAGLDIYNPIGALGRVTLQASGNLTQMVDPSRDVSITTPIGVSATSDFGNIVLNDGGNGAVTSNTAGTVADTGNKIGGNINGYSLLNAANGDASFTNTMDTILGGPAYYNMGNTPTFPYTGTRTALPDDYTPPDSTVYGALNVLVTSANETSGHNAALVLAGRIHAQNRNGGYTTLHADGDIDNNAGSGTISAGYGNTNNNLSLISDHGTIGGDDGTSWSLGLGGDAGYDLNLHAEAPNGAMVINPGGINVGVSSITNGGWLIHDGITIFGNGAATQTGDASATIVTGYLDVSSPSTITLNNAYNAVSGDVSFQAPYAIGFTNSVNTRLVRANNGLDYSNLVSPSASLDITVHDPTGVNTPSLTLGNAQLYYTDTNNNTQAVNSSIAVSAGVTLSADGGIVDNYAQNNGAAGWIAAEGGVTLNTAGSAISLTNPLNSISELSAATQGGNITMVTGSPYSSLHIGAAGLNAGSGAIDLTVNNASIFQDWQSGAITAGRLSVSTQDAVFNNCQTSNPGNCGSLQGYDIDLQSANSIAYDGVNAVSLLATGSVYFHNTQDTLLQVSATLGDFQITADDPSLNSTPGIIIEQASSSGTSLLHASGDISNYYTPVVTATTLALVSDNGSVGSSASPIQIDAGTVQASAYSNIYLKSYHGFTVQNAGFLDAGENAIGIGGISAGGDVSIHITNGGNGTDLSQSGGADGIISASTLTVLDEDTAGSRIVLDNASNAITGTIALTGQSDVTLLNSVDTVLGTSSAGNPNAGNQGVLSIVSAADLTINAGAVLSSYAAGDGAIVLAAQGAFSIPNTASLNLPNGGGWQIYSSDPGVDTFSGLNSNNSAVWNTTYTYISGQGVSGIGGSDSGNRYAFVTQPVATVTTTDVTKNEGDDATAAVAAAYTVTGLQGVSGVFQDSYSGTPDVTSNGSGSGASTGTYAITATSGSLVFPTGYGFQASNDGVLTVNGGAGPMPTLYYVANPFTRAYGAANPVFTGIVTGFQNGDTQQSSTTGTLTFSSSAVAASGVGSYAILGSGLSSNTYQFAQDPGNYTALTINAALLSYVAGANSRTYGAPNPFLTGTVTGFVNGDTQASATTGTLAFNSPATASSGVGQVAVNGFGLSASNYTFQQDPGNATALTINPATLTYVASAASKTYGNSNPVLGGTVTGFVNGEDQSSATTGTLVFTTPATTGSSVGRYAINGAGLSASNYSFVQASGNSVALTINRATLTYTASTAAKIYGDANPGFGGTVTGFVNGDTQSSATTGTLVFTTPATNGSSVGTYAINGAGLSASNYSFVQASGNSVALTINRATLTYVASAATRTYGAANPAFGGTVVGFVNGDTQASATTGTLAFNTAATSASNVGSYAINGFGLAATNYNFVQKAANNTALTIDPATLRYAANTASKTYGDANPVLGGSVIGFVNGDTQSSATTGTLTFSTSANAASGVGSYAILGSGLTAGGNYVLAQASGNSAAFTINPATLTYVATAASRVYGAANPVLGGIVTGFVNNDTLSSATTGTPSFTTLATLSSNVGSYAIAGSGLSAGNYSFVQAAGNASALTITPAILTYVATAAARSYGAANPVFGGSVTGFLNNDTLSSATSGTLVFASQADAASAPGNYAINGQGLFAQNYSFVQAAANATALTVNPVTATVTPVIASTNPALLSVTVTVSQTLNFLQPAITPSSPIVSSAPILPPVTTGQVVQVAVLTTPNPIATLTASDGSTSTSEPPTPAETATNYVADSMDGKASAASATPSNIIIPGILTAQAGPKPPPPGTGDNLSAWGNSSLWQ